MSLSYSSPAPNVLPLAKGHRYSFNCSWEYVQGTAPVDVDLQCVVVNSKGTIVDAAYYNNLKAVGRGVVHSGDERDGRTRGVDEKITVNLEILDQRDIHMLIFLVTCYSQGGSFSQVALGVVRVEDDQTGDLLTDFILSDKGSSSAVVLCYLSKSLYTGEWSLTR
jgi:tellurium resistance protein TerZ